MKTYNTIFKTSALILILISLLAATIAFAQEVTPEPPPATEAPVEVVPTEAPPVEVIPTEAAPVVVEPAVTEAVPVIVETVAPVVVAPANLDVSGVRAYFVSNTPSPVAGSPFTLDLMVTNPAAVGINSLTLQCTLDQVLFMVDPMLAMAVEPVDGQPVPTPIPGIFGVNAYIVPLAVDSYNRTATVTAAQTIGVASFASGKVESFNLRAMAAGTFNMNCTATVVDANGLTQAVSTFPLSLSIQAAPQAVVETPAPVVVEPLPTDVAPVPATETPIEAPAVVEEAPVVVEAPVEAAPVVEEAVVAAPTTGTLTGFVYAGGEVTITLAGDAGVVAMIATNSDGSFTFTDVPAGIYTITADARGYLPAQGVVGIMPGNTVTMSTVALVAGDLNNDNLAVDSADQALLTNTYRMNSATLPPEIDLDHNGRIGLGDLNVLAANMGQVGPTLWQ